MEEAAVKGFYEDFGSRMRLAREKAGLTQGQLAKLIGLTRSSVANLEAGRQRIVLHVLYAISDAVGVEPAALLPAQPRRRELDLAKLAQQASRYGSDGQAFVLNVVRSTRGQVRP